MDVGVLVFLGLGIVSKLIGVASIALACVPLIGAMRGRNLSAAERSADAHAAIALLAFAAVMILAGVLVVRRPLRG